MAKRKAANAPAATAKKPSLRQSVLSEFDRNIAQTPAKTPAPLKTTFTNGFVKTSPESKIWRAMYPHLTGQRVEKAIRSLIDIEGLRGIVMQGYDLRSTGMICRKYSEQDARLWLQSCFDSDATIVLQVVRAQCVTLLADKGRLGQSTAFVGATTTIRADSQYPDFLFRQIILKVFVIGCIRGMAGQPAMQMYRKQCIHSRAAAKLSPTSSIRVRQFGPLQRISDPKSLPYVAGRPAEEA